MSLQVIEEKFPFRHPPRLLLHPIETSRECGDPVEFSVELGEWFKSFNFPRLSLHPHQIQQIGKDRIPLQVQTQAMVAVMLTKIDKETATAAEIQDFLRRRAVKTKVLHSLGV